MIGKYEGVAPTRIINAVQKASAQTGVDFQFLMEKASTESSFNPAAKAKSSSATGLFQFIENTWLNMVKTHGEKYGLGKYANAITVNDDGKACVKDCDLKKEILNLRKNPEISALMAGEYSAENKEILESKVGGDIGATELYLAHFLGAGGAAKFLNSRDTNPEAKAAAVLPQAAAANKSVFYDRSTGRARSLEQIYDLFAQKFNGGTISPPQGNASTPSIRTAQGSAAAPVTAPPQLDPLETAAQAHPYSGAPEYMSGADRRAHPYSGAYASAEVAEARGGYRIADIVWNDEKPRAQRSSAHSRVASATTNFSTGYARLSSDSMLTLLNLQHGQSAEKTKYNS